MERSITDGSVHRRQIAGFCALLLIVSACRIAGSDEGLPLNTVPLHAVPLNAVPEIGRVVADAEGLPVPWRDLDAGEEARFALGFAVFNTHWVPAGQPAGRRDGIGPLFNAPSCDACHNDGRRGRSPTADGVVPLDLVIQLGQFSHDGRIIRGSDSHGQVLNTASIEGFDAEARVFVRYDDIVRSFPDGTTVTLRNPFYRVELTEEPALAPDTVLMPRVAPPVAGAGLLERVPEQVIVAFADPDDANADGISGRASRAGSPSGQTHARFGWQATEVTVAGQTATAFAREMGLTTELQNADDCASSRADCRAAPSGGDPEVDSELFDALVFFQQQQAVRVGTQAAIEDPRGSALFESAGCAACHRPLLPVMLEVPSPRLASIAAYTDLLLHDLGDDLADRDALGEVVQSEWRTAPLWGLGVAQINDRPLRFLHDGRARSIEEAILWHGGEAAGAQARFVRLSAADRRRLLEWLSRL